MRRRGFTLVELIVVLILVGILAVAVLPKFANQLTFKTRGFADQALVTLQYARKVAVASRRNVCVVVSGGNTLTLTMATLAGSAQTCSASVILPASSTNTLQTPSSVSFSGAFSIIFDGQGRALDSGRVLLATNATVSIVGDVTYTLGVTAGTGFPDVLP